MAKLTGVRRRCTKDCGPRCRRHKFEWSVELPAGTGGKRRQFTGTADTADQASEQRAKVIAAHRTGTLPSDDSRRNETVGEFLDRWLRVKVESCELRPSTARSYGGHITRHLVPHLGEIRLRDLRRDHIERMFTAIRKATANDPRPVGPTTERRILATLSSAIRDAVRAGELSTDHTAYVRLRKVDRPRVKPWKSDQYWAFVTRLEAEPADSAGGRLLPVVQVVAGTGLRLGEVLGLRWSDVDLTGGYLVVQQAAHQVGAVVSYGPPKTASGDGREVPLTGWVPDVLRAWRKQQMGERLAFGPDYTETGLVFTHEDGAALQPQSVSKSFHRLVTSVRVPFEPLPVTRFHDLRHLTATMLLQAGVPLVVVSKLIGHSSIGITADTYGHIRVDDGVRDAVGAAMAAFGRG